MNVASTVEIASVVDPNTSPRLRDQSTSRMSPDEPDRKKQASSTARIADGLYTIAGDDRATGLRQLDLSAAPGDPGSGLIPHYSFELRFPANARAAALHGLSRLCTEETAAEIDAIASGGEEATSRN